MGHNRARKYYQEPDTLPIVELPTLASVEPLLRSLRPGPLPRNRDLKDTQPIAVAFDFPNVIPNNS